MAKLRYASAFRGPARTCSDPGGAQGRSGNNAVKVLVTGSSGHLGEALVRVLTSEGCVAVGLDMIDSPYTDVVGSLTDRPCVRRCIEGVDAVVHTATHDKRLWKSSHSAAWRTGGMDHRGHRVCAQERIWRDKGRGRRPLRAHLSRR